jgi:MFS family permease
LSLATIGLVGGILSVVGGIPGTIMGGYAADIFRKKMKGGRMFFTATGALCCVPLWLIFLYSNNIYLLLVANLILLGVGLIWLGPAVADVHDIAGPKLRGIGVGIYLFIVNVIGYGIGPPIIGKLNDWLGVDKDPSQMKYSLLVSPLACAISALLLGLGSRRLNRK